MRTILLIMLFAGVGCFAQANNGDTTKVKYDINDPRNPDCPCHKYQKLADEEYQQMVLSNVFDPAVKETAQIVQQTKEDAPQQIGKIVAKNRTLERPAKEEEKTEVRKNKKIRTSKLHAKSHNNKKPKKRKVKFGRKDNSKCTHW